MAAKVASVSFRIDSELKNQADKLFNNLGMNLTTAFNIFLRQSVREGRIPFEITMNSPNAETISAMREAERIANDPTVKGFNSVDELMADLNE
ncbi:MAG: type II toxin-antitoxin system RelB/DinJ family antitoxin [Lachnospirales bacterium]